MALNTVVPLCRNHLTLFLDLHGHAISGKIYKDSMHPFPPSPQRSLETAPSETLSASLTPPRSPLLHSEFIAVLDHDPLYREAAKVGSMVLSIRKSYFQGRTKKFLWIDYIMNRCPQEIQRVGTALIEAAIEESLDIGLKGRIKMMAIDSSHLFYLKCGFLPEKEKYTYPECIGITQFLKRAGLLKGDLRHAEYHNDPSLKRAIEILAIQHDKKAEEIDFAFIQAHWYWDDQYPIEPVAAYSAFIERVRTYTAFSNDSQSCWSFAPMDMYLPDQSLEIWKRIIATPKKNTQERNALMLKLRSVVNSALQITI